MKKTYLVAGGGVVTLLAALSVPPYMLGSKVEQAFSERLEAMAGKNGLQLVRNQFERGWFSSQADTLLRVPGAPVEIGAKHTIYHGPLLFGRWLEGNIDTSLKQGRIETRGEIKISSKDSGLPGGSLAFSAETDIQLDGTGHSRLSSPALTRDLPMGKMHWQGLEGDFHFDAGARHVRSEFRAPGLTFATAEVSNITFRSDLREGVSGHYLGKSTFEVGNAAFAPLFRSKGLRISADTSAQGDTLSIGVLYDVADVEVAGSQYGPIKLNLQFRKLDAAVLARFQDEIRAQQRSDRPAEQLGLMQAGKLLQLLGEMARKSPELEINELRFRMGGDEIRGKAKFVLDGSKANIAENPLLMLTALAGDLDVSLPAAVIKPMLLPLLQADLENYRRSGLLGQEETDKLTPQQISAILDRALPMYLARNDFTRRLVADGNLYRLNASLRRGQVTVNGEPFSLPVAGALPSLQ